LFYCSQESVLKRSISLIAVSCIVFAGCGASGSHAISPVTSINAPVKGADAVHQMLSSVEAKLPAGTRVFQTDSVVIRGGDGFAQFAAAAKITRGTSTLTVVDAESGQTFTFPAGASVEYVSGTTSAYVPPGRRVPAWVSQSHGHLARVL